MRRSSWAPWIIALTISAVLIVGFALWSKANESSGCDSMPSAVAAVCRDLLSAHPTR